MSGSDDGRCYIWDTHTAELVTAMDADLDVLNCVQPHPVRLSVLWSTNRSVGQLVRRPVVVSRLVGRSISLPVGWSAGQPVDRCSYACVLPCEV